MTKEIIQQPASYSNTTYMTLFEIDCMAE